MTRISTLLVVLSLLLLCFSPGHAREQPSDCTVTGTVQDTHEGRFDLSVIESSCDHSRSSLTVKESEHNLHAGQVVTIEGRMDGERLSVQALQKHPPGDCRDRRSHWTGRRTESHRDRATTRRGGGGGGAGIVSKSMGQQMASVQAPAQQSMNLATGGARDINNFRRNIENDYMPMPESIRYEGLYYDYRFNIQGEPCNSLFCPAVDGAADQGPLTDKTEYFAAVGLKSGVKQVKRPPLNVVVAIDVSGSMDGSFSQYYYDRFGQKKKVEGETRARKMAVARSVLSKLSDQLDDSDRLGVVLFNNRHHVTRPLLPMRCSKRKELKANINKLQAGGGTNLSSALKSGRQLVRNLTDGQRKHPRSNRLIIISDAMPNIGQLNEGGLGDRLRRAADNRTYTTFIGVGLDSNSDLIKSLTEIRGSNAYFVHSEKQFKKRLNDEFKFMVSPLAFDVTLTVSGADAPIAEVYGTGGGTSTETLISIPTLFPSPTSKRGGKGSLILVRFQGNPGQLTLRASYTKRDGTSGSTIRNYTFSGSIPFYDSADARKGIALTRYGTLLKTWAARHYHKPDKPRPFLQYSNYWHPIPGPLLSKWERRSVPLTTTATDRQRLKALRQYLKRESNTLSSALDREVHLIDTILSADPNSQDGK